MNDNLIIPDWPAPPRIHAAVATQRSPGPSPDYASLRETLALPSEPCWLRQVHGIGVAVFDEPPPNQPEADASVTRTAGIALAIKTADCLPVLFCADDGSEIAAAHAGWRGLSAGVLESTLAAMQTPRERIIAWFGPAIAAPSYEVGDEVRDAFLSHDSAAALAFATTRPGHWLCDLYALARQRLQCAGVTRIFGGGLDTFIDPRLHSYRRDGARSGRMVSLVWTLPTPV